MLSYRTLPAPFKINLCCGPSFVLGHILRLAGVIEEVVGMAEGSAGVERGNIKQTSTCLSGVPVFMVALHTPYHFLYHGQAHYARARSTR